MKYYMQVLSAHMEISEQQYEDEIVRDFVDEGKTESEAKEFIKSQIKKAETTGIARYRLSYGPEIEIEK